MKSKQKIAVTREREVKTYAEIWHVSHCLLEKGKADTKWCYEQFMGSLIFTAFTLEAYLNHIGPKVFKCWEYLERLGPLEKLNIIAERLKVNINYGQRPWQVMKQLFEFRNAIAHGRTRLINRTEIMPLNKYSDEHLSKPVQTKREEYCSFKNAQKAREDIGKIIHTLYTAGQFKDDYPFIRGFQLHGATPIKK